MSIVADPDNWVGSGSVFDEGLDPVPYLMKGWIRFRIC